MVYGTETDGTHLTKKSCNAAVVEGCNVDLPLEIEKASTTKRYSTFYQPTLPISDEELSCRCIEEKRRRNIASYILEHDQADLDTLASVRAWIQGVEHE